MVDAKKVPLHREVRIDLTGTINSFKEKEKHFNKVISELEKTRSELKSSKNKWPTYNRDMAKLDKTINDLRVKVRNLNPRITFTMTRKALNLSSHLRRIHRLRHPTRSFSKRLLFPH